MDYIWPTSKCKRVKKPKRIVRPRYFQCATCHRDILPEDIKQVPITGYPRTIWNGFIRIIYCSKSCDIERKDKE
jgi:RNA polymerase subunit RPABC4/transcription elongation factor Spt4